MGYILGNKVRKDPYPEQGDLSPADARTESEMQGQRMFLGTKTLITSIAIDKYGFMAVTCFFDSLIHLYHVNGSYMNIEIHTAYHPENIAIDSNGRLIINSISEFDIYY